jgi:hypothetical protein
MFTDNENQGTFRRIEIGINIIVAIMCFSQVVMLKRGLAARKKSVNDGEDMKALIRFYYGIILSPLLVCTVADIAAVFPNYGSYIYPTIQLVVALYFMMFLSLLIVSSGGWPRLRSILRNELDETRSIWWFLRFKNAWHGLLSRFWMCQLIFFKPIGSFIVGISQELNPDVGESRSTTILIICESVCTIIPVIGMAMINYTLSSKGLIAFKKTTAKVNVLRLLTPVTQFAQTIIDMFVAKGRITGNKQYTAMELGHRLLSFILSISMVLVSLLCYYAYRASDFDEVSEEVLRRLSLQRIARVEDGEWKNYNSDGEDAELQDALPEDEFENPSRSHNSGERDKSNLTEKLLSHHIDNDFTDTQYMIT